MLTLFVNGNWKKKKKYIYIYIYILLYDLLDLESCLKS